MYVLSIEARRNIKPKDDLLLAGSFWLLQLWLNATFEASLEVKLLADTDPNDKLPSVPFFLAN